MIELDNQLIQDIRLLSTNNFIKENSTTFLMGLEKELNYKTTSMTIGEDILDLVDFNTNHLFAIFQSVQIQ